MVYGISERAHRALVGPENCQYDGCSQSDSKEGQESRRLVFCEMGGGVGKNPSNRFHEFTGQLSLKDGTRKSPIGSLRPG